jgi:hypothetical protein
MVAEAIRSSASFSFRKSNWLLGIFWLAVVIVAVILLAFVLTPRSCATGSAESCELPTSLSSALAEKYPGTHAVTLGD